jgi:hypothetical protein
MPGINPQQSKSFAPAAICPSGMGENGTTLDASRRMGDPMSVECAIARP